MILETSHVLMWPYVAVADAALVHHASRAASSSALVANEAGGVATTRGRTSSIDAAAEGCAMPYVRGILRQGDMHVSQVCCRI